MGRRHSRHRNENRAEQHHNHICHGPGRLSDARVNRGKHSRRRRARHHEIFIQLFIPSRVFSSLWQLHPPINHKRPISIDAWTRTSESLANDIDKEISKSQLADRNVLDFLQVLINNDPKPPSIATTGFVDNTPEPQSVYRSNPLHAFDSDLRALTATFLLLSSRLSSIGMARGTATIHSKRHSLMSKSRLPRE